MGPNVENNYVSLFTKLSRIAQNEKHPTSNHFVASMEQLLEVLWKGNESLFNQSLHQLFRENQFSTSKAQFPTKQNLYETTNSSKHRVNSQETSTVIKIFPHATKHGALTMRIKEPKNCNRF